MYLLFPGTGSIYSVYSFTTRYCFQFWCQAKGDQNGGSSERSYWTTQIQVSDDLIAQFLHNIPVKMFNVNNFLLMFSELTRKYLVGHPHPLRLSCTLQPEKWALASLSLLTFTDWPKVMLVPNLHLNSTLWVVNETLFIRLLWKSRKSGRYLHAYQTGKTPR